MNNILEAAPHPKELGILWEQIGEQSEEARQRIEQQEEFPLFYPVEGSIDITKMVQTQANYNKVREKSELVSQIILTINALQKGEREKKYPGEMNDYKYAATEYPEKYRLLVNGLSAKSLETIRDWHIHSIFPSAQADIAQVVHETLLHYKEVFKAHGGDGATLGNLRTYQPNKGLERN